MGSLHGQYWKIFSFRVLPLTGSTKPARLMGLGRSSHVTNLLQSCCFFAATSRFRAVSIAFRKARPLRPRLLRHFRCCCALSAVKIDFFAAFLGAFRARNGSFRLQDRCDSDAPPAQMRPIFKIFGAARAKTMMEVLCKTQSILYPVPPKTCPEYQSVGGPGRYEKK